MNFSLLEGFNGTMVIIWDGQDGFDGYTDADGSMAEDQHAISGYTFLIHGGTVSWSAK